MSEQGRILAVVALTLPRTLSPSKVAAFTSCPLAFRYSQIDHLPEPPSLQAVKGTFVHSALEGLFWNHEPARRTEAAALHELDQEWTALQSDPEFVELALDQDSAAEFRRDAQHLVGNYFRLEDPTAVRAVGIELLVELQENGLRLRGIIDRLDLRADGKLIVVDYKTGRAPSERYEQGKLGGVQTYALLCERVLGRAPAEVRLLHLREPMAITAVASPQTIRGQRLRNNAVWNAIERACQAEDFRPKVGPLCNFCHFKPHCPAFAAA
jgi:putative RecB family exonuclease